MQLQKQEHYINLQMDPLGNLLTTCPIQTGLEISIEPCLNWRFGCVDNLDRQFVNGSVPTRPCTCSDGPELLLTLKVPNLICLRDSDSTRSIRLMKHVGLVFKDPHGLIWPMIVTMQKWFTIFNLLIKDHSAHEVQVLGEGYASSRLWFHTFVIRLQ